MSELDRMPHREPVDGDIVVGCGHGRAAPLTGTPPDPFNVCMWFEATRPISISHPMATGNLYARWLSLCGACLLSATDRDGKLQPHRVRFVEHWSYDGARAAEPVRVIR